MATLDEQVKWEVHAPQSHYRFGGPRLGRAGVLEAAAAIAAEYSVQRYDVKELVAEGQTVWAFSEVFYIHNNKPLKFVTATRWVLRSGKVIEFHGFFDSAYVLAQQGRLATE